MNNTDWLKTLSQLQQPLLKIELATVVFLMIIVLPIVAYLVYKRRKQRKQIAERGIKALSGKCPVCGGKLKIVDLFSGRGSNSRYKIGAARCTKCRHLEIFSEEP